MSREKNLDDMLFGVLEKSLFKEERLDTVKVSVKKLELGKISAKEFKQLIIRNNLDVLEELRKNLSFYFAHAFKQEEVINFSNGEDFSLLKNDLDEKNEFLAQIGQKINSICKQLRKKAQD